MELKVIAANQTEVSFPTGLVVFFSYDTPVAARTVGGDYIRTSTKWSQTTSRHINKWLDGITAIEVDQSVFDSIAAAAGRG